MKKNTVMLHIIMPNQVSGPNTANKRMASSWLSDKYNFRFVTQSFHAKGKINITLLNDLRKQIKEVNPDIVHLSGLQSSGFHAIVAARLAGCKKIIIAIRGSSGDAIGINALKKFVFTKIIEPITLRLCTKFYTVSTEASRKKMVQNNKKKYLGVIHNAAPEIKFDIIKARKETRKELGANQDDFLVAISGRMVYDKGISYIIEAVEKIEDKKIKFVFIGDGPYCEILKNQYKGWIETNKIHVLGQRNNVMEILSGCDLFLFATLHENLSNALLEAMAVGLPVVATNVGGNPEVVQNGENGFLIPPENSDKMVEYITKVEDDERLKESFSKKSVEIISEKFSQEHLYKEINSIYKLLLNIG